MPLGQLNTAFAWLSLAFVAGLAACTTPTVTMKTEGEARLSVVGFDRLQDDGEVLGPSPQTIELSRLKDKVLKIKAADKETQYWVFTATQGQVIEAKATLTARAPDPTDKVAKKATEDKADSDDRRHQADSLDAARRVNADNRLLLRAYEALYSRRTALARDLAQQLAKTVPRASAPYIIIGLAYLQDGSTAEATSSLAKAKTLDPDDSEIERLLRMVQ